MKLSRRELLKGLGALGALVGIPIQFGEASSEPLPLPEDGAPPAHSKIHEVINDELTETIYLQSDKVDVEFLRPQYITGTGDISSKIIGAEVTVVTDQLYHLDPHQKIRFIITGKHQDYEIAGCGTFAQCIGSGADGQIDFIYTIIADSNIILDL